MDGSGAISPRERRTDLSRLRRGARERFAAWVVTGPLGHLYGTVADLAAYAARHWVARAKEALRRPVGAARRSSAGAARGRVPGGGETSMPAGRRPVEGAGGDSVCIIGAGSSGIAACQVLKARGIPFDCFEKGSSIGGNWRYMNDNGMSSAYRSLFINTSRRRMAYSTFPMPDDYPDYPHHTQIARYFDDFVDRFGFRDDITFNTEVTSVRPAEGGGWEVATDGGESRSYRAVMVANGHHWDPRWPQFPGEFAGDVMHAHDYKSAEGFEGSRVLVLGIGNSACDIACETSRVSDMTFLAMRRGAYVIPKYLKGQPTDELSTPLTSRLPLALQRVVFMQALRTAQGTMEDYGLPKPDHKLMEAHPTVSAELLQRIGHGRVKPTPNIERLDGDGVRFVDGSRERIDRIVYCTGYKITFPFLSSDLLGAPGNRVGLYRRVVHPELEGLYFIGLVQPLGAIMPLAELQSEWVADLLEGKVELPSSEEMARVMRREDDRMSRRYVKSDRHTIQVDFFPYVRTLKRERRRGRGLPFAARRAERSHELRVEAPA